MNKVTVYIESEERLNPVEAYLLDPYNVIAVHEGHVKVIGVKVMDWRYVQDSKSFIILGQVSKGINEELLVHNIVNRLKNTTMYEYLLSGWDRSEDVDFKFVN
jgi:hypothetical protein